MDKIDKDNLESMITLYFDTGLLYKDIVEMLAMENGVRVSLRLVKRYLRRYGLGRRKNHDIIADVVNFVQEQIQKSGKMHGYRWMYQKYLSQNIHCKKEDIE